MPLFLHELRALCGSYAHMNCAQFEILICFAVNISKQCLQAASASGRPRPPTEASTLDRTGTPIMQTFWVIAPK